jgi:hypothetical protein
MSEDSFVKEVSEALKNDRLKSLWDRYGIIVIGGIAALILVTACYEGYKYWHAQQATQSGDTFLSALKEAKDQKIDSALKSLEDLKATGMGSYPVLAQMRTAAIMAKKGDIKTAVSEFDTIISNSKIDSAIRDIARLRLAYLMVDHGSYTDVSKYAEILTNSTNKMRHSAREALGLAAFKAGKAIEANQFFQTIVKDHESPSALQERAQTMINLLTSLGKLPSTKTGS